MSNRMKTYTAQHALTVLCSCFILTLMLLTPSLAAAGDEMRTIPTTIEPGTGMAMSAEMDDVLGNLGAGADGNSVEMSLDQLIQIALQRNLTLVTQRYERKRSLLGIDAEYGIYDFNLEANGGIFEDSRPTGSALEAAPVLTSEGINANFKLTRLFNFGGQAEVDFNNRFDESSNTNFDPNPQYNLSLDLTFSQPLLRNFGKVVTERNIVVAKTNAEINRADFQAQVENIIEQAVTGYWDLVEAREQLEVARESLSLAEELHEMNRVQVDVGTMAPLELIQSEAGVAARQEDIIRFEAQVQDREDLLRRLVSLDRAMSWDTEIVPVTEPEVEHVKIDVKNAVETAFDQRPEIRQKRLQNETLRLDAKVAENQLKPRLDARATWGLNAIDGERILRGADGRPIPNPDNPNEPLRGSGGYGDAFDQITGLDFDGWSIGVTFAMPLENSEAKARATIAELAMEQGELELRDLEDQIFTDVRRTARGVETAAQQIATAKVSSRLARKNLEAEQKRYENGLSTSFQVLQIQEDLSEALRREVSAVISYRRAQVVYRKAISQLLDTYDVRLADDMP